MDKITGKKGEYEVGKVVAENDDYRVRSCTLDGREFLLQVPTTLEKNSVVQANSGMLLRLKRQSDRLEKEFKGNLNYDLGFPNLHETFYLKKGRQVNVIDFRNIPAVGQMLPVVKLWKDGLRIDISTSAWILGKLLKTIAFAHDQNIEVDRITGGNVLIEPDQHYVVVYDWSDSSLHDEKLSHNTQVGEIKKAAKCIIKALGGDLDRAQDDALDEQYTEQLKSFARGDVAKASKAHKAHYDLVDYLCDNPDSHWERGFYKFTTKRA
tara:strand:+ start:2672 stop:3469 length:798 start_codon:yes stop_codon:yes gene_type:complete